MPPDFCQLSLISASLLLKFRVPPEISLIYQTLLMKTVFQLLWIWIITFALPTSGKGVAQFVLQAPSGDTTYRIIPSEAATFGYEIIINNKVLIRQKSIPGFPGNRGFTTRQDAMKTARLVLGKLRQGILPPTISPSELDGLHIRLPQY